ncbi:MAG: redoxin domain-containing protein [Fuerstiella sp.]
MTAIQFRPLGYQLGIAFSLCLCIFVGCGQTSDTTAGDGASPAAAGTQDLASSDLESSGNSQTDSDGKGSDSAIDLSGSDVRFKDSVSSNVEVPVGLDNLVFVDTNGDRVALETYLGKNNIVLVFTEGFAGGMLCPFCKTQTSRLVANFDRFKELDTKVFVVYPGARDHLDEFIEAATKTEKRQVSKIPFPLVLDEKLEAVKFFNISSNLAHPSTFIIDKQGNVKLAYVGADMTADRPSISAMLKILSDAQQESTDSGQ